MPSREKYMWQSIIGLLAALYLVFSISESNNLRVVELFYSWVKSGFDVNLPPKAGLLLPFIKEVSYPLGALGFVAAGAEILGLTLTFVNLRMVWSFLDQNCPESFLDQKHCDRPYRKPRGLCAMGDIGADMI